MLALVVFSAVVVGSLSQDLDFRPYDKTAESMFEYEDHNGDGFISLAEVIETFDKYDSNSDGRISRKEYACYQRFLHPDLGNFANALFDEYDSDGDHHLDHHDLQAFYGKIDKNADSNVTKEEFVAFWTQMFVKYENYHLHGHHHHHNTHNCHD